MTNSRRPQQKVLVTGGAGYIGTVLVRWLLESGYSVRIADLRKPPSNFTVPSAAAGDLEISLLDIRDKAAVVEAIAGVNAVVHLAAIVGDPACAAEPEAAVSVNLDASKQLYELAEKENVHRFVFASTCSTYGSVDDTAEVVDEETAVAPISLYGETKCAMERHLLEQPRSNVCKPTCLRFATAYGLSDRTRFDLTVNEFVKELVEGNELEVFGQHTWRPYCHTKDLARAIESVLRADCALTGFEVFNVGGSDENYSKQDVVDEIRRQVNTGSVRYVDKGNDRRNYRVSFSKLQDRLGFRLTHRLADGVQEIRDALRAGDDSVKPATIAQ